MDLRKSLFGNIVLSGGSTLTKGFGDRLLHEVQRLAVKDMRIKIFAPPERKYSTWIGGSILAGLSTFRKVCGSKTNIFFPHSYNAYVYTDRMLSTDVGQHRRLAREPRNHPHKIQLERYPPLHFASERNLFHRIKNNRMKKISKTSHSQNACLPPHFLATGTY